MNSILTLKNITHYFGGLRAVHNFNIELPNGALWGLIGPNGAGKTTIFNLITGVYKPTEGKILFEAKDITGLKSHLIIDKGIARTFQNLRIFNELSVLDNIRVARHFRTSYKLNDSIFRTKKFFVSVFEVDQKKIHQLTKIYPVQYTFYNFDAVDLSQFDAVLIATPANYHIPMAKKCILAGKPFLIEKPLAVEMEGVDELVKTIKEKSVPCGVAYTRRSIPSIRKIMELIDSGIIGEVKMVNFYCAQDYRKYRTDFSQIYFAKKEMGGGILRDFITHMIDLAQWIIGRPEKGYGICANLVFGNTIETDDSAIVIGKFAGKLVSFYCNVFQKPNEFIIDIAGTKANLKYVLVTRHLSKILFADDDSGDWKELYSFTDESQNCYYFQAEHFYELLQGREHNFTTIEEAAENLRFILEVAKSSDF
ncbi:MAG: Gfo/Idh/MocA family protein [Ignavibacterium sp.]